MEDTPLVVTETDVKEPALQLRFLRKVSSKLTSITDRLGKLEFTKSSNTPSGPSAPSLTDIRDALQASGRTPLNVNNLLGQLAQPQSAGVIRLSTAPTGQVLQQYKDQQFLLIGTSSTGYSLQTVIGGNPNTLFTLVNSLLSANFMTLDTVQTSTGAKTLQGVWAFQANPVVNNSNNGLASIVITNTSTFAAAQSVFRVVNDVVGTFGELGAFGSAVPAYGMIQPTDTFIYTNSTALGLMCDNGPIRFASGGNTEQLTLSTGGIVSKYHTIATAGEGIAYIVGLVNTSTSAAIGATTIYTPAASGVYRAGVYLNVITVGASTGVTVYVNWTDNIGLPHLIGSGPITTTSSSSTYSNTFTFRSTGATAITYTSTVSGATGVYGVNITLERLS